MRDDVLRAVVLQGLGTVHDHRNHEDLRCELES
jgi:hypothetical protein